MSRHLSCLTAGVVLISGLACASTAMAAQYSAIQLVAWPGQDHALGIGLTVNDEVVAMAIATDGGAQHPISYVNPIAAPVESCSVFQEQGCTVTGVNDRGEVVGGAMIDTAPYISLAYVGNLLGGQNLFGPLTGDMSSEATAINRFGMIVGQSYGGISGTRGFVADRGGMNFRELPGLGGGFTKPQAVSSNGMVVGMSEISPNGPRHAFAVLAQGDTALDLGTLGGESSTAFGINDDDVVVGEAEVRGNKSHGFRANADGTGGLVDLGLLKGYRYSRANAINKLGVIVGAVSSAFDTDDIYPRAVVYYPAVGKWRDLNVLTVDGVPAGVRLAEATAINKKGHILVNGSDGRIYLLKPIPASD